MDTGEGKFVLGFEGNSLEELNELAEKVYPNARGIFEINELIEIRGSKFKVAKIDQFGIRLRLLK